MLGEGNDVGMPYFLEDVFDMGWKIMESQVGVEKYTG
jgi:hypothetical protein